MGYNQTDYRETGAIADIDDDGTIKIASVTMPQGQVQN